MKEATSDLNSTVVVVVIVGVLSTFFFGYLWPLLKGNFNQETGCKTAVCNCNNDATKGDIGRVSIDGIDYCTCEVKDGQTTKTIKCVYKG